MRPGRYETGERARVRPTHFRIRSAVLAVPNSGPRATTPAGSCRPASNVASSPMPASIAGAGTPTRQPPDQHPPRDEHMPLGTHPWTPFEHAFIVAGARH